MTHASPTKPTAPSTAPWEPFAIASVAFLALPLVGPVVSIVLGSIGVRRIQRAQSPKRGWRMAWAGMGLGWLLLILECAGVVALANYTTGLVNTQAEGAIAATLRGDSTSGTWLGPAGGGATPEQVATLHDSVKGLGDLREVRMTNLTATGWPSTTFTMAFIADFEKGVVVGSADMIQGQSMDLQLHMLVRSMTIEIEGKRTTVPPAAPATEAK